MTVLFIFGGLIVVGVAVLMFYRGKWGRTERTEERRRSGQIEDERIEKEGKSK